MKARVDREGCIGCGACAAVCPDFWQMNDEENKTNLKGSTKAGDGLYELEIGDDDVECNRQAEDVCPVNVIKVTENGG